MANTFKLKTKTGVNGAALSTVYTVPSSTTAVIIGLTISNIKGQSITADAQIVTASSSGENADDVYIVKDVPFFSMNSPDSIPLWSLSIIQSLSSPKKLNPNVNSPEMLISLK